MNLECVIQNTESLLEFYFLGMLQFVKYYYYIIFLIVILIKLKLIKISNKGQMYRTSLM